MTPQHSDLIDAYLSHLRARRCTPRTVQTYRETLALAHAAMPLGVPLATGDEIAGWLDRPGWSGSTVNLRLTALRGFFRWAVRSGHLDYDPTITVEGARESRRRSIPPATAQVQQILARTTGLTRLASTLAAHAGLRAIEITRLRRADITEQAVTVHEGKGGHSRQVPTHPDLWAAVEPLPAGLLVPTNERLLTSRTWRAYRRQAGVETSIHRLRAWFATELWRAGVDLETIRALLGHRSLATTQRYLGADPARMSAAVAALPTLTAAGGAGGAGPDVPHPPPSAGAGGQPGGSPAGA